MSIMLTTELHCEEWIIISLNDLNLFDMYARPLVQTLASFSSSAPTEPLVRLRATNWYPSL